ncbi:EF-hand calcium-binding domain-containing protein 6 [Tenrec ecaudatus]|uniref:EF-hand calcium-binding domain-containing protein 6 n=1 Tax=Tenrec ecaudatus TaxID=94439 RepID=UPI003F59A593
MKRKNPYTQVSSFKSCSTRARGLMETMEMAPDGQMLYFPAQSCTHLRPHSSPCRVFSSTCFHKMLRPSSTATAVANPWLSSLDIKRLLFKKINQKRSDLRKAFQLLDLGENLTVSKSELRRVLTAFLLPLTGEQFQDLLAQSPLTSSGAVLYLEFLSKFGGVDLNGNVTKRASENDIGQSRTLHELEAQLGDKVSKNSKALHKALRLLDVNKTGLLQPWEIRRVLETFCLRMGEDEYTRFSSHYNVDKSEVDYKVLLKNLSINNDINSRYSVGNPVVSRSNQQVKHPSRKCFPISELSEDMVENCSLDEIQRTFCQEIQKSYERVEKSLSAGDTTHSGFVSLSYLKTVLDTFVYRLPRRLFLQLMKRLGLNPTLKINWKQFLTSCDDPLGLGVSSSIPSPRRNSFSSCVRNSRNQPSKDNVIARLAREAEDHGRSLKKAFLAAGRKYEGSITGEELQAILNSKAMQIHDSEFKELMQMLDPWGTGQLSVHALLDLLEEESSKIRKRSPLTSTKANPLSLAWDSVEEMVCDGIMRDLPAFYQMVRSYDPRDTGFLSRMTFKKIISTLCPFLTGEHLIQLCSKFQDTTSGRICYKKLMASLVGHGWRISSPAATPAAPPPSECVPKEDPQRPDLPKRIKSAKEKLPLTKNLTKEDVMGKLQNYMQQSDPTFRKQFFDVSKEPTAKITERDFRKVLEMNGMWMDNEQFALLTTKIGFRKEGMSYLDFAARFQDMDMSRPASSAACPALRTRLSSPFASAEECLKYFPQRLKESFQNPYSAFFKVDKDRDGIISMQDLYGLLAHLQFNLKQEEFVRFLELLGLRLSVTLNFREFRHLCEKGTLRVDDAPQRLIRQKQKVTDSELASEQAHQYLVTKAKNRWSDLSKNFIETDSEGRGILRRRDIKNALYGFDIPLTPREFEKLWTRYDTEGRGHITYQEFLQKLGISYQPAVHRPYAEDYFNFMGHFTKPKQIQEELKELQRDTHQAISARDKLKDCFQELSKALSKCDKPPGGCIPMAKLQAVLQECGCSLKEEELATLLNSWGVSCQDDSINYLDFLKAVDTSKAARPQPDEKEESKPVNFATLHLEEVLKKVQETVDSCQEAMSKAFTELDQEDTGLVTAAEFGQVLKDFCCNLSDSQYHYFLRKVRLHLRPHINWKYFLQNFSSFLEESAVEWAEKMPKAPLPPKSLPPKDMGKRDILARLHKAVTTHYNAIVQEFENFDTMKAGVVSRDEFRAICNRHVQILTDEQFDKLWSEMPVTTKGKLKYQDFLSRFSCEKAGSPPISSESTRAQKGSILPEVSEGVRSTRSSPLHEPKVGTPKTWSHPCTPGSVATQPGTPPLRNCEPIETKLRKPMQGCWRELLRDCKEKDTNKQGAISAAEFLALVEKYNLDLSREESQQLITKYDLKNNGKFAYCDFIQSCVLLLTAKETSLMRRMKIQNIHHMKEAGEETSSFYAALLRIQPKILHCWRPMRRTFKAYDQGGTGLLGVGDFRKVLRQYSINLSEEEFFHILEYYDKTLSSKISYNDFLRAFLQ